MKPLASHSALSTTIYTNVLFVDLIGPQGAATTGHTSLSGIEVLGHATFSRNSGAKLFPPLWRDGSTVSQP